MVDVVGSASSLHYAITGRPNCSLSAAGTCCVFLSIATITLIVAFGFFLAGAWVVLPFAGAELGALFWSLRYVCLHAGDYERLTIDHDKVLVEHHTTKQDVRFELNGYWARVILDCQPNGYCRRLALRSHGKEIEFGRFLSSEERLNVGRLLKSRLGGYLS
ncbi:uncharacterized protein NMK_0262 [Novimethylophilus kurashikiensis]|uniref:DUF2244 domain-containing protein n=1 Tax=Novimethylophilus kurashikiensis TaxID=1825523 RepID=A0A2R5F262_9PROT|nr:DUF2244 domain-containing protein [Novimethylophilus kurashikiensis]GBG12730.1 uncharacterized protein NMK_0262 [Novimethylophilus kurashikiensis]